MSYTSSPLVVLLEPCVHLLSEVAVLFEVILLNLFSYRRRSAICSVNLSVRSRSTGAL